MLLSFTSGVRDAAGLELLVTKVGLESLVVSVGGELLLVVSGLEPVTGLV